MPPHPYGWLSLLPPVVAIVLAIATRRVVLPLLAGIFGGALILRGGNPIFAVSDLLEKHLWVTASDETNLRIFTFTLLMGGMIAVISRAGGMRGLINLVTPWAKDRRRGQLTTWIAGLFIFFDDYANSIVLGNTLRAFSDRLRISREKLAFLVDATAAPVAGIAPLSTWVAVEILQIAEGLKNAGAADRDVTSLGFELFLYSIPYRFYAIWMLIFIPLVAVMLRDFGPMRKAELEMATTGRSRGRIEGSVVEDDLVTPRWYNAVVPIGLTLGLIVWLLYQTGYSQYIADHGASAFAALSQGEKLREILGAADSPLALLYGSLAGLALVALFARVQKVLSWKQIGEATGAGMTTVLPAIAILITAMTLSGMTKGDKPKPDEEPFAQQDTRLYTGVYLSELLLGEEGDSVRRGSPDPAAVRRGSPDPAANHTSTARGSSETSGQVGGSVGRPATTSGRPATTGAAPVTTSSGGDANGAGSNTATRRLWLTRLLPTIVFLLAAVVAFCTGTSYGTMGILMPMTISLAYSLLGSFETVAVANPILLGAIGGVLAGSIFGDHCSPISDTTVLSSQASGCNHIAHVRTQMPYAAVVGSIAVVCGTLPLGFGVSVWVLLPLGVVAMIVVLLLLGRPITEHPT